MSDSIAPAHSPDPRVAQVLDRLELFGVRLGLDRIRTLLRALGQPQDCVPGVLIAGTNGKGSTAAFLAAIAGAAGYRVGLYTSPHLESVEERIRLDGRAIPSAALAELLAEVLDTSRRRTGDEPTYFEALTAAAFLYFEREAAELAILEVGLGGRLDATNVVEPVLGVITSIGLDHEQQLGETRLQIAREKAGIFRPGLGALAFWDDPEAGAALRAAAAEVGVDLENVADIASCDEGSGTESVAGDAGGAGAGPSVTVRTPVGRYGLELALAGEHQRNNVRLAVRAAESLARLGYPRIDARAIETGVARCRWPGRLERVELSPSRAVLLDCAHNPAAALALASFLDRRAEPYDLLYGSLNDKRVEKILPVVARGARRVILTSPGSPRAMDPAALSGLVGGRAVTVEPDAERALEIALSDLDGTLTTCGSLYLVGTVRQALRRRYGRPLAAVVETTY